MSITYKCKNQYSTKWERTCTHFVKELKITGDGHMIAVINATVFCGSVSERTDVLNVEIPTLDIKRA